MQQKTKNARAPTNIKVENDKKLRMHKIRT